MRRSLALVLFLFLALGASSGADTPRPPHPATVQHVVVGPERRNNAFAAKEEIVAFNRQSLKYHCLTCSSAKACTRNCSDVPLSEAKAAGGVACKRCGGTCRY